MHTLGGRIKLSREKKKMTQKQLGEKIGAKHNSISNWENDQNKPDADLLERICDALEVDANWLLGYGKKTNGNYMTFSERLKTRRESLNMSVSDLSEKSGINIEDIENLESNAVMEIDPSAFTKLAEALNCSTRYLAGLESEPQRTLDNIFPIEVRKFPLLGNIACGEPIFADEDFEGYVEAGANIKADFCLRAKGDSMINARIFDGDIVFIRKQSDVDNGQIAAVLIDNDATLKRVYKYNDRIELRPENPTYPVQNYEGEQINQIIILGRAVAFQSDVK